jgi:2-dehydropantoate 2-reductase
MRQVPHYFIIGNGRVARHFQHYFSLLQLSYSNWHRQEPLARLAEKIPYASHILLLISDSGIENFISTHLKNTNSLLMHFSGSLTSTLAYGTHPLMTFGENLYSLEQYQTIPFVIDHDAPDFAEMFPHLPNQHVRLRRELKAKYHALCVLSGNFSCMLWQKLFNSLEKEFNLSPEIAHPYFLQQTKNIFTNPNTALTGPLVRNDVETIQKNLAALASDPFQEVYESFVKCYQQLPKE